jgi:glucose-1-phosphate adenylyltransferase
MVEATVRESMIAEGSIIGRALIEDSVVGIRSRIADGVQLHGTLVMGNDRYQTETEREADLARGTPPMGLGEGSVVRKAILDKDARIGRHVRILNEGGVQERDGGNHYIREGIVIVPKAAVVPDGMVI